MKKKTIFNRLDRIIRFITINVIKMVFNFLKPKTCTDSYSVVDPIDHVENYVQCGN